MLPGAQEVPPNIGEATDISLDILSLVAFLQMGLDWIHAGFATTAIFLGRTV